MAHPQSKCYISLSKDPKDIILHHPFNKQADIILPYEAYEVVKDEVFSQLSPAWQYHCLRIPLSAILEKDFYNKYIKTGNIVMLSEGRIEADNMYCMSDGKLRLSLSKEYYEKAGLVGKPARFGGRKGQRWLVEFDLRSDKMMHGSKALERIVWSFTEVLTGPMTFLFCDLYQHKSSSSQKVPCPILEKLGSAPRILQPHIEISGPLTVPSFSAPEGAGPIRGTEYTRETWKEWALDIHEWLGMVAIDADRIKANDTVDPYLSTYQVPNPSKNPQKVTRLRWRGMIPAGFIHQTWTDLCGLLASKKLPAAVEWAAITVHGFDNSPISWGDKSHSSLTGGENCYTVLRTVKPGGTEVVADKDAMEIDQQIVASTGREGEKRLQCLTFEVVGSQDEHS
ncbi:ribonuclease P 40kDa subunit-domain-containing protein [Tirmania nivea]|nr:ribonuclease P 40kDa subunit-domain-containing protein [Tirmania nivea]